MSMWLKQSTAIDVSVGPFVDSVDGVTPETGLTITQPDIRLKKNGGAWAQKNAAQTLTHEENGWYEISLDATDTNTLGNLLIAVYETGALPVWREFQVVPANVWDSFFGADLLDVSVTQVAGQTASAAGAVTFPGTIASTTNITAGTITTATNVTTVNGLAAGVITATSIAADAITDAKVASDVTIASVTGAVGSVTGAVGSVTGAVGSVTAAVTVGAINANVITATSIAADAITDAKVASDVTIASVTGAVGSVSGAVGSVTGAVGSVTAAVTVGTNNDKTGYTLSAAGVQAVWDALTSALTAVGSIGKKLADWTIGTAQTGDAFARLGAPAGASVSADIAAAKADTAGIKAKTDSLAFTVAGQVDANIQSVNDVTVNGNGAGTPWGP